MSVVTQFEPRKSLTINDKDSLKGRGARLVSIPPRKTTRTRPFSKQTLLAGDLTPDRMQSAKAPPCKNREILNDRMRADLRVYRDAVAALEAASLGSAAKTFDKAVKNAGIAQRAFEAARERLNQHTAEHGC
jgi:hypothetical protein